MGESMNRSISEKLLGHLQSAWAAAGCGVKRSPAGALAIAEQVSKTFSHHFDKRTTKNNRGVCRLF